MTIEISSLPKPTVKEELDYETELQGNKDQLKELYPEWDADVESDSAVKLLEVNAYNSVTERQRVNDAALAVMLPWAKDEDVDNLAANFNLTRNVIQEADDTVSPPLEEILEDDDSLKERILLAWSTLTNAGTPSSYTAHARQAHAKVKAAIAVRVSGGVTKTYVLSYDGDGTPTQEILDAVSDQLNQEDVRQLCSTNTVEAATITTYTISAVLDIKDTAVEETVLATALKNTQAYVDKVHDLNSTVSKSALDAAMHIEGVKDVDLGEFENIVTNSGSAPYCTNISITPKARE
ncbi:baseplate assembly protein [Vibrio phage VD1]|nr:baseplate assembly protein [Vibrio phage VD1]